eukprot:488098_1
MFITSLTIIYLIITTFTQHCVDELPAITPAQLIKLPIKSANFSIVSSVSYHPDTSTILIAGIYFKLNNPKNISDRTYYSFFQAFNHTNDNKFTQIYNNSAIFQNTAHNKYIKNYQKSWYRIIAHPTQPYFYTLNINNLTAYNIKDGSFLWTASIATCNTSSNYTDIEMDPMDKYVEIFSKHSEFYQDIFTWIHNDETFNKDIAPVIYNDISFWIETDPDNIYVAGTCGDPNTLGPVIVIDSYTVSNGIYNKNWKRLLYRLFDIDKLSQINFGLFPPDITIDIPKNESFSNKKYFFIGYYHLIFAGVARVEQDGNEWSLKSFRDHYTVFNPSFITHRSLITTQTGLITLMDPNMDGLSPFLIGTAKHFISWKTNKTIDILRNKTKLNEKLLYQVETWYGTHNIIDLHLQWTMSMDTQTHSKIYVTTAPLFVNFTLANKNKTYLSLHRNSTIAKHDITNGDIIGGANASFYAIDSIVTNDEHIITVGMTSDFKAVWQIFSDNTNPDVCVGCQPFYYGSKCEYLCKCKNGHCRDDLSGDGHCWCTLETYGDECRLCHCGIEMDTMEGICNAGSNGDGWCKLCLNISAVDPTHFGLSNKYGQKCDQNCTCVEKNGVCYSKGENGTGHCLYCTNKNAFGLDCENICICDNDLEWCDNGIHGRGCVKYKVGGLIRFNNVIYYFVFGFGLFTVFFIISFWQSNKHWKQKYGDKPMPFFAQNHVLEENNGVNNALQNNHNDLNNNLM